MLFPANKVILEDNRPDFGRIILVTGTRQEILIPSYIPFSSIYPPSYILVLGIIPMPYIPVSHTAVFVIGIYYFTIYAGLKHLPSELYTGLNYLALQDSMRHKHIPSDRCPSPCRSQAFTALIFVNAVPITSI